MDYIIDTEFILTNGSYSTLASLLHQISEEFKRNQMPFSIEVYGGGRVKIKCTTEIKAGNKIVFNF